MKTFKYLALASLLFSPLSAYALTVCGITINSDNEIKALKRALGPSATVIELFNGKGKSKFNDDEWMNQTCRQQIQCDVVVLSAHFGGIFMHEDELAPILLSLEPMERASCSNQCKGVFQRPKEVYLLGCYSGESKDPTGFELTRIDNPHQEPSVLPLNSIYAYSHYERMRRIFPNAPRIYGYPGVGPVGPAVESSFYQSMLAKKNYFASLVSAPAESLLTPDPYKLAQLRQSSGVNFNSSLRTEAQNICSSHFGHTPQQRIRAGVELVMQANGVKHIDTLLKTLDDIGTRASLMSTLGRGQSEALAARLEKWHLDSTPVSTRLQTLELEKRLGLKSEDLVLNEMRQVTQKLLNESVAAKKMNRSSCGASETNARFSAQLTPAFCHAAKSVPTLKTVLHPSDFAEETDFGLAIIDCVEPLDPGFIGLLERYAEEVTEACVYKKNLIKRTLKRLRNIR